LVSRNWEIVVSLFSENRPVRLCRIATVPVHITMLLREQLREIIKAGLDVTVVSSPGPVLDEIAAFLGIRCYPIPMMRSPHPGRDMISLNRLIHFLRFERFDIVHSSTPKAGLLAALAGILTRVPVRIHTFTGQPWVERSGIVRLAARESDRLIARLDTHTYADSASQRNYLISEGLVKEKQISVLGAGSISGVDLQRFDLVSKPGKRETIRKRLGIPEASLVIVFVGRVTKDKGIVELIASMRDLWKQRSDLHLLLVGQFEPERDPLPKATLDEIVANSKIHSTGFVYDPENYMAAADIFCLPSYREGFGGVVIEAGAMHLPTVATRITGLVDAVVEGETGILVPPKDVPALVEALLTLIQAPELRQKMGAAAFRRSTTYFNASDVNKMIVDEYYRLVGTV
jgi:glycosyltransferase involved in cell wall biosynthesis